jgi:peptidyl-prolyl cis-trans isomerase SurA
MSDSRATPFATAIGRRPGTVLGALAAICLATSCGSGTGRSAAPATDVLAVVDGRDIHREDVEKAYRRLTQVGSTPSEEEVLTAKLSILNELILQDILVSRAAAMKVEVTEAELEAAFTERKQNLSDDAFQKELAQRGLTAADMKEGLRREMLAQKVIDHEVGSKISVSEQELIDYYNANKSQFNLTETAYHIAQIVITPVREAQLNNRANDDATSPEAAERKARMLMDRLKAGSEFSELAAGYSEDPQSAPRGGDLGFVPASALKQLPPVMRDAVLKATPGGVTKLSAGGAHTLMLLVEKESAGQRDLTAPAVREGIMSTLRGRREQLLRTAFLTVARNDATVVNHFARELVETQGKK